MRKRVQSLSRAFSTSKAGATGTKPCCKASRLMSSVLCAFVLLLPMTCTLSLAAEKTVTVAYIDYENFVEKQPDGSFTGYGVDYLERIADYTGWKYEYIDMDWPTAYEAVKNGTVDFYCVARSTQERAAEFDFSVYPVCDEEMNIYTLPGAQLYYNDYTAFDGMKFGVLENSQELSQLNAYANENGFTCTVIQYPTNSDTMRALDSGEVDAAAIVKYSVSGSYRLVGNFGVSPAYMMSCEGSEYMKEFNKAQEKLYYDSPDYTDELQYKYYGSRGSSADLMLTRDEVDYINSCGIINVALSPDMAPLEYFDEDSGSFKGVSVDLYERISSLTGLKFNFVKRENSDALRAQMASGSVQLIGATAKNEDVEKELNIRDTAFFSESSFSIVTKDYSAITPTSRVAVPDGYPMFTSTAAANGYKNYVVCSSFDECVRAVNDGEADFTYMITMCESYHTNHVKYSELNSIAMADTSYGICFGVDDTGRSTMLLSIINKCISIIPQSEINEMIVVNSANAIPDKTLADRISENAQLVSALSVLFVFTVVVIIIRAQKYKQQRKLNESLKKQHDYIRHLYNTLPCGVFQCTYDEPHRITGSNAACAKIYGCAAEESFVGKSLSSVADDGTQALLLEKFTQCEKSGEPILYIRTVTREDGSECFIECVMDIVETDGAKAFQEVFIDVTERELHARQTQKRYMLEQRRSSTHEEGLLFTACFDITEQKLVETTITLPDIKAGISTREFVNCLSPHLRGEQSVNELESMREKLELKNATEAYDRGELEYSFVLSRRTDGSLQWLRSDIALRYNPLTGHLMCFDYIWDVTDEQIADNLMRQMALADCDGFMSIDIESRHTQQYRAAAGSREMTRSEAVYGESDIIHVMAGLMDEKGKAELLSAGALDTVIDKLTESDRYQIFAVRTDKNGNRIDKAVTYFYTDKEHDILAATVSDVTEVRRSEVLQAQLLSDALAAAERANAAKGQFLSRVSHEMRTPLNAIIGFLELCKGAPPEDRENYLASSDIAAKQLLAVINDVLDMSSIESGKIKIASADFNFKHMISSITSLYGTQCSQKGISFKVKMKSVTEEWLKGDELRVNQILTNLIGNAVKFTSEGGVVLTVSQINVSPEKAVFRFEVADTGCGMSEGMLDRMFVPFEQESAATTRRYGGSGLGLSIVKSLVSMMGGSIRVESTQGKGSVFTVDLPFVLSDLDKNACLPEKTDKLRVLAVDDEPTEREYLNLVFERMGIRYTCVASGNEALAELERGESEGDPYSICLVDWMMPELNGGDTVKLIRKKYGSDVMLIVASAYDYQQAGEAAKDAGANMFLSKPIFQSSLFDLFMTLTDGKLAEQGDKTETWDFSGRRVLLAEDNILNQIVAKGYLAKFNVAVDVASNGQECVDAFESSEPDYYDAILMDIQMPVMDGFEAAKAIRASSHRGAKTVPIIAQSADAFNEDITKSLSSGMNAHVAKPIKPDVLAEALAKAFQHNKPKK